MENVIPINVKLIKSEYLFSNTYTDSEGREQETTVKLCIDSNNKSYSILPNTGQDFFKFVQTSHKWAMWKATVKGINDAICFANSFLGVSEQDVKIS